MFPLFAAFEQTLFMLLLGGMAIFLILLVLVQRGRGGGLAGALGGMGGSSAFGAKAGDVFTKITAISACLWIILCIVATKRTPSDESLLDTGVSGPLSAATLEAPANADDTSAGEPVAGDSAIGDTGAAGQAASESTGATPPADAEESTSETSE